MVKRFLSICVVLAFMLAGCAPSPISTRDPSQPTSAPPTSTASQDVSVVYRRSGGFAGTDDLWTITADGTVSHRGQAAGTPDQLTVSQRSELTAALRAADFMSLESSYVPKDTCCDRYLYEITVTMGEQSKTVRTIDAAPAAPAELILLIDTLNRLVTAAR